MKKITVKKWLIACMASSLWTSACYAQDSVKVKMICFEYDDSGSVVLEQLVSEKEEMEDIDEFEARLEQEEQKEQQQTEQNTRLGLGHDYAGLMTAKANDPLRAGGFLIKDDFIKIINSVGKKRFINAKGYRR